MKILEMHKAEVAFPSGKVKRISVPIDEMHCSNYTNYSKLVNVLVNLLVEIDSFVPPDHIVDHEDFYCGGE